MSSTASQGVDSNFTTSGLTATRGDHLYSSPLPDDRPKQATISGSTSRFMSFGSDDRLLNSWSIRPAAEDLDDQLDEARAQSRRRTSERNMRVGVPTRVQGMQKWHGRVVEVDADGETLTVELQSEGGGGPVLADFPVALLNEPQVGEGDVVYVTVRTVQTESGYPMRTSMIRLRRPGKWSPSDVARVEALHARYIDELDELFE